MAFNIPAISQLNLSRDHIVGIYNGTYRMWNDQGIQEINPSIELPERIIQVLARKGRYTCETGIVTYHIYGCDIATCNRRFFGHQCSTIYKELVGELVLK